MTSKKLASIETSKGIIRSKFTETDKVYVYDIETNGLYWETTLIHCLVLRCYWTDKVKRFVNPEYITEFPDMKVDGTIEDGIKYLNRAACLVGHNIISYDGPTLNKIYPNFNPKGYLVDTLTQSRLIFSNLYDIDKKRINSGKQFGPGFVVWDKGRQEWTSAIGRHSLEAWGLRLGEFKDEYGSTTNWESFDPKMLDYCEQDTKTNKVLSERLELRDYPIEPQDLEFQVQKIITEQEIYGWEVNVPYMSELYVMMTERKAAIVKELREKIPAKVHTQKTPQHYFVHLGDGVMLEQSNKGQVKAAIRELKKTQPELLPGTISSWDAKIQAGPLVITTEDFNPSSAAHIAAFLESEYGFKAEVSTTYKNGKYYKHPLVNTDVLSSLDYPEAKLLVEYEVIQDRLEKLKDGKKGGYLTYHKNGRLHGYCNPLGAVTFRATHSNPNVGQVPSVQKNKQGILYGYEGGWGYEFRSFFKVREGYRLVGTDASGQELRCLSHVMAQFDGGEYGREVVSGDVHTRNQHAAGLPTRDNAKTFIYGFLYGAGNEKIGKIVGKDAAEGGRLKKKFLKGLPALAKVIDSMLKEWSVGGYIMGLDGRKVYARKDYSALNSNLQSMGAILTKRWMVIIDTKLREAGIKEFVHQVGWIHDELQFETREDLSEQVGQICKEAMTEVEKFYNFKCQLDAEYKVGANWAETH